MSRCFFLARIFYKFISYLAYEFSMIFAGKCGCQRYDIIYIFSWFYNAQFFDRRVLKRFRCSHTAGLFTWQKLRSRSTVGVGKRVRGRGKGAGLAKNKCRKCFMKHGPRCGVYATRDRSGWRMRRLGKLCLPLSECVGDSASVFGWLTLIKIKLQHTWLWDTLPIPSAIFKHFDNARETQSGWTSLAK